MNNQILVWTMGKVGSRSIIRTLEHNGFKPLHIHRISWPQFLEFRKPGPPTVINLVRDPLARNLAAMFQNIEKNNPTWHSKSPQELADYFCKKYSHNTPTSWFMDHFHRFTNLNTFSTFNVDAKFGYTINKTVRCLTIRLDLEDEIIASLLSILLNKNIPNLINDNISTDKIYAKTYAATKNSSFDRDVIEATYSQETAQIFWSEREIQLMKSKWKIK